MLHSRRLWKLVPVASADELACMLTQVTWTSCTAMSLGGYLFANDSTSPDGAQEYAVLQGVGHGQLAQIESITFSWCSEAQALELIERILLGAFDFQSWCHVSSDRFQTVQEHGVCGFCT